VQLASRSDWHEINGIRDQGGGRQSSSSASAMRPSLFDSTNFCPTHITRFVLERIRTSMPIIHRAIALHPSRFDRRLQGRFDSRSRSRGDRYEHCCYSSLTGKRLTSCLLAQGERRRSHSDRRGRFSMSRETFRARSRRKESAQNSARIEPIVNRLRSSAG